jgi:hypothetical protein
MARSQPVRQGLSFLGIFDGNGIPFADFNSDSTRNMTGKIYKEVSGRNGHTSYYLREIETFEKI